MRKITILTPEKAVSSYRYFHVQMYPYHLIRVLQIGSWFLDCFS